MTYRYQDIIAALREIGLRSGGLIYVAADMLRVHDYEVRGGQAIVEAYYNALREIVGETGTIVSSTRSVQLCNTDVPYNPPNTRSNIGAFAEYVRLRPGAVRSFHPFTSYTANGQLAETIATNNSRHSYGPHSPEDRLINNDALMVSIGADPTISCSTVHHVEHMMAVPYRYTKEFIHPVVRGSTVSYEPFYMYVWYRDIGVERDRNIKLFERIGRDLDTRSVEIGRGGRIYAYSLRRFFELACAAFVDDMYIWCKQMPTEMPYRK